jgi:hypothetical protein
VDEARKGGKLERLRGDEPLATGDDEVLSIAAADDERMNDAVKSNRLDEWSERRSRLG